MSGPLRIQFGAPQGLSAPIPRVYVDGGNDKAFMADCLTAHIPADGTAGYAAGCILQVRNGSAGTVLYVNEGSKTSCDFNAILAGTTTGTLYLPMEQWKVWDAMQTNLPGTAATDDLGLTTGTFLTDSPTIKSVDFGGTSTTAYARRQFTMPMDYVTDSNFSIIINASMQVVADASATIDLQVAPTAAADTDICATAAQSVNSASGAVATFSCTPSLASVSPGSTIDMRMTFAGTDAGNAQNNINLVIASVRMSYTRYK